MGLEQGRLWALRNPNIPSMVLYDAGIGLPTLYNRKKDAEAFKKRCKSADLDIEVIEVEIVEKAGRHHGR